ncbi:MAG: hypothetical protein K5753_04295, partial [Clostridia bacterium]|nr:hypothetical protein [Clostridia bacterium]
KGKYTFDDNGYYTGNFSQGYFSGHGIRVWGNGDNYEGMWQQDEMQGQGKLTLSNGDYFEGVFSCSKFLRGKIECHYPNGDFYIGEYSENGFNGFGYIRYSNGATYEGCWKNNDYSGHGKVIRLDGIEIEGDWTDSKNANNVIWWEKGTTKNGRIVNNVFQESEESRQIIYANRGSTASGSISSRLPENLVEEMIFKAVKENPFSSNAVDLSSSIGSLGDSRWPASEGWVKMQSVVKVKNKSTGYEYTVTVHYVANKRTYEVDDFKIKN